MTPERADVIVLGLGPAGASAAAAAARRGLAVVALDRKRRAGHPVQCAEFVPALLGIEVGELARTVRQRVAAMRTWVERDAPDLKPDFPGHMLDRAAFDAALVTRAERAGARCLLGARVRRVTRAGAVELADGRALTARVLIGADGPRSLAGRALGRVNRELVETRQVTVPLLAAHAATDIFLSAAIPGGYGWLFPKGEVANIGAGVAPAQRAALKPIVARLHADAAARGLAGTRILATTGGPIPVGGMLEPAGRLGATRVLLAGDAAGLANPVTGAGIAAAVQSGRLAGEAAARGATADAEYAEELAELYAAALGRALARRRELLGRAAPDRAALRRGWIAYPEYWAA